MHFDSQLPWKVIKIESAAGYPSSLSLPPCPCPCLRTQLQEAARNTKMQSKVAFNGHSHVQKEIDREGGGGVVFKSDDQIQRQAHTHTHI